MSDTKQPPQFVDTHVYSIQQLLDEKQKPTGIVGLVKDGYPVTCHKVTPIPIQDTRTIIDPNLKAPTLHFEQPRYCNTQCGRATIRVTPADPKNPNDKDKAYYCTNCEAAPFTAFLPDAVIEQKKPSREIPIIDFNRNKS